MITKETDDRIQLFETYQNLLKEENELNDQLNKFENFGVGKLKKMQKQRKLDI